MRKSADYLTGPEAYARAERKTRYGRRDCPSWIGHKSRSGELVAERQSVASVKRALLAVGTQGSIRLFVEGHCLKLSWKAGLNLFYQLRYPGETRGPGIPARTRPRSSYSSRGGGHQQWRG